MSSIKTSKLLVFVIFFLVKASVVFAEGSVDELKPIDLDGDGKMEKVTLVYSEPDDYGNCTATLQIESLGKVYSMALKEGFNADTTYLKKLVISPNVKPFVMVDSKTNLNYNRRIYSFDGRQIKEELVIFSNFPKIEEKDMDHDGINEIVAKYRDDRPGRDPKKDSYERYYKWSGMHFYDSTDDRFKHEAAPSPSPKSDDDDL